MPKKKVPMSKENIMKCSVCLNDYKGPMFEASTGPVCDSCWYKSDECAEMDERMRQFQIIRTKLKNIQMEE